jgi:proton-translocating NADH-quinone oxidoreductase chain N
MVISQTTLILFAIFIPVIGAFLLPVFGRVSEKARDLFAFLLVCVSFACSFLLLPATLHNEIIRFNVPLAMGFNFNLQADLLAVFMALISMSVGAVIIFYSFDYISHYTNRNEYYFMAVLFLGSMMGIVYSANLIFLFLFWEITAITSWRLIGFFREKNQVLKADKSFLVTVFGALLMLAGFIIIYYQAGSFDLPVIREKLAATPVSDLAVLLILCGIFSKSATFPLHTWLPDAGVAPSPVTALLHAAVLVKIGVYVYARLFMVNIPLPEYWRISIMTVAAISALVSAGAALTETDLKRIIAYSTISQIGFIFLGLASGSVIGAAGALLYILMHALSKGGLFLCAGIVEQNMKTKDITKLGGLIKTMPVTAMAFLLCSFSVIGIPPFGGFFSKYMVISGAVQAGHPVIALVFIVGAFLTVLYLMRVFVMVFLDAPKTEPKPEKAATMVFSVALLATLGFIGGILISFPSNTVAAIVKHFLR